MERGLDLKVHRIQEALGGKAKTVRGALIAEMESLLREILPDDTVLLHAVADAIDDPTRLVDLGWVKAPPIAILAQRWLAASPETSVRQLAIRIAQTVQKMGYSTSHHTIQPILAGYKKKTRGFVYRAMLKQLPDNNGQVPAEHILPSRWLEASLPLIRVTSGDMRSESTSTVQAGHQVATSHPQTVRHGHQGGARSGSWDNVRLSSGGH